MLREPRGYPAANCNLILPSNHPEADAGFVIMEQVEYPPMSGTNTICVVTVLIETGMVKVDGTGDAAQAGNARRPDRSATRRCSDGKVRKVTFRNVPAFATHLGRQGGSAAAWARSRWTWRRAACSTSSPTLCRSG